MLLPRSGRSLQKSQLPEGLRYRAFLSYRTADRQLAEQLHKALETYRVPRSLVGTQGEHGPIPARLGPIFRDRDDARTAADIEAVIAHELGRSQHLVVLCTPRSAAPESWVPREIEIFRERRPAGEIHCVIGDGSPPDCFPAPLLKVGANGRLEAPLAADLRPARRGGQDGPHKAVVKVVAGLLGVPFDELWRREARRLRRRRWLFVGSLCALASVVGAAYGIESRSLFVREEAGSLVVWKGRPGLNLPGFPQRFWTLDQPADSLLLPEGTQPAHVVLAVGPGQNLLAELQRLTRKDYLAAQHANVGQNDLAREIALQLLASPEAPFEERLFSLHVLAEVAKSPEEPLFKDLLGSERSELRLAAVRALFRLNPSAALQGLSEMREDNRKQAERDLVRLIEGPCSPAHRAFLERAFQARSNVPANEEIVDAAARSGCRLGVNALLAGALRPGYERYPAVPGYAKWSHQEVPFSRLLIDELTRSDLDEGQRGDLILTLATLDHAPCAPALRSGLTATNQLTLLASMAALAKFCPDSTLKVGWNAGRQDFDVSLEQSGHPVRTLRIAATSLDASSLVQQFLGPSTQFDRGALAPALRALLAYAEDDTVRTLLIEQLIAVHDLSPLPRDLLDSNSLHIRRAVIEHRRLTDERGVVTDLLSRLGGRDAFYETQLGRIPLQESELERVRELLSGDSEHRRQAACVLAMQGPAQAVRDLLTDPDNGVRQRAADCSPFNREAKKIAETLPPFSNGFPLERYASLREEVKKKTELERELARVPAQLQFWRLHVIDRTPSGWGLWNAGMRAWLEEQHYQRVVQGHNRSEVRQGK